MYTDRLLNEQLVSLSIQVILGQSGCFKFFTSEAESQALASNYSTSWSENRCSDKAEHARKRAGRKQPQRVPWLVQNQRYSD